MISDQLSAHFGQFGTTFINVLVPNWPILIWNKFDFFVNNYFVPIFVWVLSKNDFRQFSRNFGQFGTNFILEENIWPLLVQLQKSWNEWLD